MQEIGVRRSWKVEPLLAVHFCPDGQAPVSMAAFPAEGMRTKFSLVTGHMDGKIHYWGSCADPVLSMTLCRDSSVDHIATPATGRVVVAALGNGTIILISPEQQRVEYTNTEVHQGKTIVALKMWEDYFVTADSDGKVVLWSTLEDRGPWTKDTIRHRVLCTGSQSRRVTTLATGCIACTMLYVVVAVGHGAVQLWRANSTIEAAEGKIQLVATLTEHHGPITSAIISPDVTLLSLAGKDNTVSVWDLVNAVLVFCLPCGFSVVCNMMYSPNRYWQLVQSPVAIAVVDLENKDVILRFNSEDDNNEAPRFSSLRFTGSLWSMDGVELIVGRSDGAIMKYRVPEERFG